VALWVVVVRNGGGLSAQVLGLGVQAVVVCHLSSFVPDLSSLISHPSSLISHPFSPFPDAIIADWQLLSTPGNNTSTLAVNACAGPTCACEVCFAFRTRAGRFRSGCRHNSLRCNDLENPARFSLGGRGRKDFFENSPSMPPYNLFRWDACPENIILPSSRQLRRKARVVAACL